MHKCKPRYKFIRLFALCITVHQNKLISYFHAKLKKIKSNITQINLLRWLIYFFKRQSIAALLNEYAFWGLSHSLSPPYLLPSTSVTDLINCKTLFHTAGRDIIGFSVAHTRPYCIFSHYHLSFQPLNWDNKSSGTWNQWTINWNTSLVMVWAVVLFRRCQSENQICLWQLFKRLLLK